MTASPHRSGRASTRVGSALRVELGEGQRPALEPAGGGDKGALHVEAQREALAVADALLDLGLGEPLVQTGIERGSLGIEGAALGGLRYLGARGKARIEQPLRLEPLSGLRIDAKVLRLAQHRLLPGDAEPGEILKDA